MTQNKKAILHLLILSLFAAVKLIEAFGLIRNYKKERLHYENRYIQQQRDV